MLSVSVIVPVHEGGEAFDACLLGLALTDPPPDEIIIVPDGSTNPNLVRQNNALHKILSPTTTAHGPAHARNRGARASRCDILFFVDADVVVPTDAILEVRKVLGQNKDVDALIGSYDDAPGRTNFLSQYRNLLHHFTHQTGQVQASTFWGACGAIRRDVFEQIGGFNEDYARPSIEDIELGYRLIQSGRRIFLHKRLQVKHLKYWNAKSILKTDFFGRALPWTELILQRKVLINDLNIDYSNRLSIICVYLFPLALVGSVWNSLLLIASAILIMFVMLLNSRLYSFFVRKRGILFGIGAMFWHWIYFLYSGLGFAVGLVRYLIAGSMRRQREIAN